MRWHQWVLAGVLGTLGCEAEPARPLDAASAPDALRLEAGRLIDAAPDALSVDAGPDAMPDAMPDRGVGCALSTGEPVWRLALLHSTGAESALISPNDVGGAARFVTRINALRVDAAEVERSGVLAVSAGDSFLAGATFAASLENGVPYFDGLALAAAGFDAVALGNHDFDFGPDVLADFIRSTGVTSAPPAGETDGGVEDAGLDAGADAGAVLAGTREATFLATNLDVTAEPALQSLVSAGRLARSAVIETNGVRVGVVGATQETLAQASSPREVRVTSAAAAVQNEIDALEGEGVRHIVLVAHLGDLEAERALAERLRGVDVLVASDDVLLADDADRVLPGDVAGGPYPQQTCDAAGRPVQVVAVPGGYRYLGRLLLDFDADGEVVGVDARSAPLRVLGGAAPDASDPDPWVVEHVEGPVRAALAAFADNEVAITSVPLDGRRARLRSVETNLGSLVADALMWSVEEFVFGTGDAPPDVALMNGGGIRNNATVPVGSLTELDTFAMLPFASFVSRVPAVSREALKMLLENGVSQVEDGAGRFPQVAGMRFGWDPARRAQVLGSAGAVVIAGERIRSVELDDGTRLVVDGVVQPGPALVVATIDFLARGGDQYPFGGMFEAFGVSYQQALRDYVAGALEGEITAERYPEAGLGRIREMR